ncbi:MAG: hypothetical protein ACPL1B_02250 [Thermoprotei archaeon]
MNIDIRECTNLDANIVIDKIRRRKVINESITVVTLIEYPYILDYAGFNSDIIFPT